MTEHTSDQHANHTTTSNVAPQLNQTSAAGPLNGSGNATDVRRFPDPLQIWNNDLVFRQHLSQLPEPNPGIPLDYGEIATRVKLLKIRIRDLEKIMTLVAPQRCPDVEAELAASYYKCKYYAWITFKINELAPEILSMIFRMIIRSTDGAIETDRSRLHLSTVCRRWRYVAINDSALWTSIWFRDSPPWERSLTYLQRAGARTLDIQISEPSSRRPANSNAVVPQAKITSDQIEFLLDHLFRKASQIRNLVIAIDECLPALTAMRRLSQLSPPLALERLEVHRTGQPTLWMGPPPDALEESGDKLALFNGNVPPRLKWLCINGLSIDWDRFPATNLTTIDLRRIAINLCPSSRIYRSMLQRSPNLFKLVLNGVSTTDRMSLTSPSIFLPNLRDLLVGSLGLMDAASIFMSINAPGVRSLTMMRMTGDDYGLVIECLVGRFPEVRLLTIYDVEVDDSQYNEDRLTNWFGSMPRLQFLKISQVKMILPMALINDPREHRPVDPESPEAQPDGPLPPIAPECRYFHFDINKLALSSVMELIMTRAEWGVPFRKVYLSQQFANQLSRDDLEKLFEQCDRSTFFTSVGLITEEESMIYTEMEQSQTLVPV